MVRISEDQASQRARDVHFADERNVTSIGKLKNQGSDREVQKGPPRIDRTYADVVAGKDKNLTHRSSDEIQGIKGESRKFKNGKDHSYWVRKETEVLDLDWNRLMVVTKGCAHDDWNAITRALKEKFTIECVINPIMVDKGLLRFTNDRILKPGELSGKWRKIGNFHLKLEKWSPYLHNRSEFIQGTVVG